MPGRSGQATSRRPISRADTEGRLNSPADGQSRRPVLERVLRLLRPRAVAALQARRRVRGGRSRRPARAAGRARRAHRPRQLSADPRRRRDARRPERAARRRPRRHARGLERRMTVYTMQFHAEREELIEYVAGWVGWHGLAVVAERFFPEYEPVAIPPGIKLRDAIAHLEPVRRICLARDDLDLGVGFITTEEFMTVNPDCLAIALERVTEDGLRETALATLTADRQTLAFW